MSNIIIHNPLHVFPCTQWTEVDNNMMEISIKNFILRHFRLHIALQFFLKRLVLQLKNILRISHQLRGFKFSQLCLLPSFNIENTSVQMGAENKFMKIK